MDNYINGTKKNKKDNNEKKKKYSSITNEIETNKVEKKGKIKFRILKKEIKWNRNWKYSIKNQNR